MSIVRIDGLNKRGGWIVYESFSQIMTKNESLSKNPDYYNPPQRGDFESHKAYSPSLQHFTPQARIPLTLQDFTNTYKGLSKYNYRKLRKNRKHMELHKLEALWSVLAPEQSFNNNLAKLWKTSFKNESLSLISNMYQYLLYFDVYIALKERLFYSTWNLAV